MSLALCLFCKDENPSLEEWLTYHTFVGAEHIYIFDNRSAIPIRSTVIEWIRKGLVSVLPWEDDSPGRQCRAYAFALHHYGKKHQWMAFIDTDEFIVMKSARNINDFMCEYGRHGGLGVFWACFGSNGHQKRQNSVIEAYTFRANDNWISHNPMIGNNHIKSIVQTKYTYPVAPNNPHIFHHHLGKWCVDEDHGRIDEARRWPRLANKIQINHYFVKSREEWLAKQKRGGGNGNLKRSDADWNELEMHCNSISDTTLLNQVIHTKRL